MKNGPYELVLAPEDYTGIKQSRSGLLFCCKSHQVSQQQAALALSRRRAVERAPAG